MKFLSWIVKSVMSLQNKSYIWFLQLKFCEPTIYTKMLLKLKSVRFLLILSKQK